MFQHEVQPVDQFACDLYDGLALGHSFTLFGKEQVHRRVLSYSHPCSLYQVTAHYRVLSQGNVTRPVFLSAAMAHRDHSDIGGQLLGIAEAGNVANLRQKRHSRSLPEPRNAHNQPQRFAKPVRLGQGP